MAITGRQVGPPLYESLEVLGKEKSLNRIEKARENLAGGPD
jgi:glutamyl-tRNA synthetase